jgi:type III secretion system OrgA/MxiK family protein
MTPTAQLLNVMYAPVAYTHADHWPASLGHRSRRVPASIANERLIAVHSLATRLDFEIEQDSFAALCVAHWATLPRVCELIGARFLRTALVHAHVFAKLDSVCQRFMMLPLPCIVDYGDATLQPHHAMSPERALTEVGLSQLNNVIASLPHALQQRLRLLFPFSLRSHAQTRLPLGTDRGVASQSVTLLNHALKYALIERS